MALPLLSACFTVAPNLTNRDSRTRFHVHRPDPGSIVPSPISSPTQPAPVTYVIDGSDQLALVNDEWDRFALANGAPHLVQRSLLGQPLWDHIREPTVRQLYAALFARVRHSAKPMSLPFRCDSPDRRRYMELRLAPGHAGALLLSSLTVREERRESVALLDAELPRDDERALLVCSWCKRVEADGAWLEVEDALRLYRELLAAPLLPALSHGICLPCQQRLLVSLDPSAP
jgi:hypothetical protein